MTILESGSETRVGFRSRVIWRPLRVLKQQQEEPMSKHDSVTKRNRRPKSEKRIDYTARTMAAIKQLEQAAKLKVKDA